MDSSFAFTGLKRRFAVFFEFLTFLFPIFNLLLDVAPNVNQRQIMPLKAQFHSATVSRTSKPLNR